MEKNNLMDYETEKENREAKISELKTFETPPVCSYCTSANIEYICPHLNCIIYACEKCAFYHGEFLESKIRCDYGKLIEIKSNNKIFWHCKRYENSFHIDKGYWLNETFISNTGICNGCQKIFPTHRLLHCVPQIGINIYLCSGCENNY